MVVALSVLSVVLVLAGALVWRQATLLKSLAKAAKQAMDERDAAIRSVRYVRMTNAEFEKLAKTGCTHCHGVGVHGPREAPTVCKCVLKRVANHANYAMFPDGTLCRLATQMELDAILGQERTDDVIPIHRGVAR